jgi:ribosomal protein S6
MSEENIGTEVDFDKKIYEIGYHIVPSVPEDKLGEEVSSLKEVLEKNGAVIISEESPKLRALSYEMRKESAGKYKKYTMAYFGWIKFEALAEKSITIGEAFKNNSSILRYILIKTVRENTMSTPRIPSYKKAPVAGIPKSEAKKEGEEEVKKEEISDSELDKAIDAVIAE